MLKAVPPHQGLNAAFRDGSEPLAHQSSARNRQYPWTIESPAVPKPFSQCGPLHRDLIRLFRQVA